MTKAEQSAMAVCRNCDCPQVLAFCPQCGQRRLSDDQRRLPHLLGQFVEAAIDLDGRFWRSVRALLLQPGRLSHDYIEGRRMRWIAPMPLFLLVNVLFFLFSPVSDLNLRLDDQLTYQFYSDWIRPWVMARIEARGITLEDYAASYWQSGGDVAKSMVLWHVPWLAAVWQGIFFDRRLYYAEHFVAALHAIAYILGIALVIMWIIRPLLDLFSTLSGIPRTDSALTLLLVLAILWSFQRVARGVYRVSWWRGLLSLPLMVLGLVIAHMTYRGAQFLVVFAIT